MGDFPYPSSYMLNGNGELPAYPVRAACDALAAPYANAAQLLSSMASAVGVFYNFTATLDCFDFNSGPNPETDADANYWDYQWCTEMFMPSSRDGGALCCCLFWGLWFWLLALLAVCQRLWRNTNTPSSNKKKRNKKQKCATCFGPSRLTPTPPSKTAARRGA